MNKLEKFLVEGTPPIFGLTRASIAEGLEAEKRGKAEETLMYAASVPLMVLCDLGLLGPEVVATIIKTKERLLSK